MPRNSDIAFKTKGGKEVGFRTSGARKAARSKKKLEGTLRSVVNPSSKRTINEGTRLYRKLRREGVKHKKK